MEKFYTRTNKDNCTVEIKITIPKEDFRKNYQKMLGEELMNTDIKGFRKGKVPASMVEPQIGNTLKMQTFEKLLPMYVTTALQKENISPIAPPDYKDFPNFDDDKDIEFSMDITIMPEFKLGNISKIKIKKEEAKIEAKEIEEALKNIFDHNKEQIKTKEIGEEWAKELIKKLEIKEATDLKTLKEFIKQTLKQQKETMLARKQEDEALKEGIKISKIEIPQKAIAYEAEEREHSFTHDMEHRGVKVDDFLKGNNITIEKMRELWLKDAQEALESDTFLKLYAKEKGIKVTDAELKEKIEEIKKGAPKDTDLAVFDDEEWKEYIRKISEKEKAFAEFIKEVTK